MNDNQFKMLITAILFNSLYESEERAYMQVTQPTEPEDIAIAQRNARNAALVDAVMLCDKLETIHNPKKQ